MQRNTDWIEKWRALVVLHQQGATHAEDPSGRADMWQGRAREYLDSVKRRWERQDSSQRTIVAMLESGSTVLDIGAGVGAWSVLLARHAARVTAVEPSVAMREVMEEHLLDQGIHNVDVVPGSWPEVDVQPHDFCLCAHALYGYPDIEKFVCRMSEVTRRTCFLLLRVPTQDGVMADAARHIWGQPYDSPNFVIAYNALLQMGLFPDVKMEDTGLWAPWSHDSLDAALAATKRRFALQQSDEHDAFLRDLLLRRLCVEGGRYVWPRGVRSALVWWNTRKD